ncbi:MAG: SurA N-terminal domain-containing protein [Desulfobacterales bacterium]|nr:SurA N-terminal domain-containing protein [Desulfobacterales bacterium]
MARNRRKRFNRAMLAVVFFCLSILCGACKGGDAERRPAFLLRVGQSVVTSLEFQRAFEIAKAAYPHNALQEGEARREAQLRLLEEMIDELILLEEAQSLRVEVGPEELAAAIQKIKADYPEGLFEQVLLENAIPYAAWEKAIRRRLLIEKVVEIGLTDTVELMPEDISAYLATREQAPAGDAVSADAPLAPELRIDTALIRFLRKQKAEAAYADWLKGLYAKYAVEINHNQWSEITGAAP